MLSVLIDKKQKRNNFCQQKLTFVQIENFYKTRFNSTFKIGLEYERLSLDKDTLKPASYDKLKKIIANFSSILNWNLLYDNGLLIGAHDANGTSISLEPGNQLELSLKPFSNIIEIDVKASELLKLLDEIGNTYNVLFLGYGISPNSNVNEISLLKKERYILMDSYLPYCKNGELCPKMMRQTAGIQINIDYFSSKDAYNKLKFLNLIMPFMMGLSSNSSFEKNKTFNYKTNRGYVWRFTGSNRCNFFYKDVFKKIFNKEEKIFKNYIHEIFKIPMIFIHRDGKNIPINGNITFEQFMKNGYLSYQAEMTDYILHQSLCFPDVRLKNYIEIRNHDSNNINFALALCAFYKGLFALDASLLLKQFNYLSLEKVDDYNIQIIKNGLAYSFDGKFCGFDVLNQLFNIAKGNLSANENIYLNPILNILKKRLTKSDEIISQNISTARQLVDFLYE